MSRFSPPSPAPSPPDAQKPRIVCKYSGMNILDCRERIQIVIEGAIPRGAGFCLRNEGFTRCSKSTWDAPATPMSIATAQAIGNAFFQQEQETP